MEVIMQTDLQRELPQVIGFNYSQLKEELARQLEKYRNLVVTEDAVREAAKDRASLNKLKKALDDKRKSIKGEYMKPYDAFEAQVKELISMVDEPVKAIDGQIKEFERQAKEKKQQEIEHFFNQNVKELRELVTLNMLYDPKWLNKTVKLIDITREIMEKLSKIRNDLKIIGALGSEFGQQMQDVYLRTFDMSAALAEQKRLEEQKEKLKRLEKEASEPSLETAPTPGKEKEPFEKKMEAPEKVLVCFEAYGEMDKIRTLVRFMKDNGIECRRVKRWQSQIA